MSTFKMVVWIVSLLTITIFIWQNLTEGMVIKLFLWNFSLPTVVGIFLFMFIGSAIVFPLAIKSRRKKRKKEKEKEEKQQQKQERKNKKKKAETGSDDSQQG